MILIKNEIMTSIEGHDTVTNLRKMISNNPRLNLVNFFQFVLKLLSQKETLTLIKGRNSVPNLQTLASNTPNLSPMDVNVHTQYC